MASCHFIFFYFGVYQLFIKEFKKLETTLRTKTKKKKKCAIFHHYAFLKYQQMNKSVQQWRNGNESKNDYHVNCTQVAATYKLVYSIGKETNKTIRVCEIEPKKKPNV